MEETLRGTRAAIIVAASCDKRMSEMIAADNNKIPTCTTSTLFIFRKTQIGRNLRSDFP